VATTKHSLAGDKIIHQLARAPSDVRRASLRVDFNCFSGVFENFGDYLTPFPPRVKYGLERITIEGNLQRAQRPVICPVAASAFRLSGRSSSWRSPAVHGVNLQFLAKQIEFMIFAVRFFAGLVPSASGRDNKVPRGYFPRPLTERAVLPTNSARLTPPGCAAIFHPARRGVDDLSVAAQDTRAFQHCRPSSTVRLSLHDSHRARIAVLEWETTFDAANRFARCHVMRAAKTSDLRRSEKNKIGCARRNRSTLLRTVMLSLTALERRGRAASDAAHYQCRIFTPA